MRLSDIIQLDEAAGGRNIANLEAVDGFIQKLIGEVPEGTRQAPVNTANIKNWVKKNLRKWFINSYDGVERITKARRGLPDWLIKQAGGVEELQTFLDNNEVLEIVIDDALGMKFAHIIDYLVEHSGPKEDLSRWAVNTVIEKADEWSGGDDEVTENAGEYDDTGGVKPLLSFENGTRWVQILHATDEDLPKLAAMIPKGTECGPFTATSFNPVLRKETLFMRHCVGAGYSYDSRLKDGDAQYYSLRDKKNEPHVTIEAENKNIRQLHGKKNEAPDHKYTPAIIAFLNHFKMNVQDDHYLERARIMKIGEGKNAVYYDRFGIAKLPVEELKKLNFTTNQLRKLGLVRIEDELAPLEEAKTKFTREQLKNSDLTKDELESIGLIQTEEGDLLSWPEMKGKTVTGNRNFEGLLADPQLPEDITFSGNVVISQWGWNKGTKTLPKGMHVKGNLTIRESERLAKLPLDLKVDGRFEVSESGLKVFPQGEFGNVVLSGTQVTEITNCKIEDLKLQGTSCKKIGSGCTIFDLDASESNLEDIDPSVNLMGLIILDGTPIKNFKPTKIGFALSLENSKCETLSPGLIVGFNDEYEDDGTEDRGHINLVSTNIKKLPKGIRSITETGSDIDDEDYGIVRFPFTLQEWPEDFEAASVWFNALLKDKPIPETCRITALAVDIESVKDGSVPQYSAKHGELDPGAPPTKKVDEE